MIDPNNPVVKLCVEGMRAEGEGQLETARALFTQAWEASTDDFEACIAAHYLARRQENPQDTLHWNQEALNRAEAVGDDKVGAFYPSLYLNMGYSYELLGNMAEARRYYDLASEKMNVLPDDRYGGIVRTGVEAAKKRVDVQGQEPG